MFAIAMAQFLCYILSVCMQIWAYDIEVMDWVRVSIVSLSLAATSAIAWAQPLGRPMELLALAIGSQVDIMGLTGHVDHLKVCTRNDVAMRRDLLL